MEKNNFITSYGFFSTIVVTVVGIGIFSYPREMATLVGGDVWIVTIASGLINLLLLKLVIKAIKLNGYRRITEIIRRNFGTVFGAIVMTLMILPNIASFSLGMRAFVEVVKMYLLEKTPTEFLILVTILVGMYLVRGGIRSNVKFNEIALWIMFLPMLAIILFAAGESNFTNILPVLRNEPGNYLKAIIGAMFSFGGLEITYLISPLLKNKERAFKTLTVSMSFIIAFYVILSVLCIAMFTTAEIKNLLWPTIAMVRTIEIPGSFVERWDGVVMALWVMFYFTTFANNFTFSSYLLSDAVALKDIKLSSLVIAPVIYLVAMIPTNISELYMAISYITPVNLGINLLILPFILIITSRRSILVKKEGVE
ncbi:GerAB/ArcD/ProY family transporter [Clostridium thermarum]|uniref:GerAB/ArcD/ProY family transporter n=1 Tax=Clostridium thermarum TaxID=1716543 RepID=UPI0013D250E2|nr:endospore germination permease [Clostridium thermarum]